jgi:hypothetical protein
VLEEYYSNNALLWRWFWLHLYILDRKNSRQSLSLSLSFSLTPAIVDRALVYEAMQARTHDDDERRWVLDEILAHRGVGPKVEVSILWDTDESTWESLVTMGKDDSLTLAQ